MQGRDASCAPIQGALVSTPHSALCLEKMQRDGCCCRPSKNVLVSPFPPAPLLKRAFASPPAVGYNGYNKELSLQRENCTLTIFVKHLPRGKPDAAPLRFADDVSRAACGSARYDAVFAPPCMSTYPQTHIICVANIIRRSRYHLPKGSSNQKTHICYQDKCAFLCAEASK